MAEETLTDVAPDPLFDALDDPLPFDLGEGALNCGDPPSADVEFVDASPGPSSSLPRNIRRRITSRGGEYRSSFTDGRLNASTIDEEGGISTGRDRSISISGGERSNASSTDENVGTPSGTGESRNFSSGRRRSSAYAVEEGREVGTDGDKIVRTIGTPGLCKSDPSTVTLVVVGDSFGEDREDSEISSLREVRKGSNDEIKVKKQHMSVISSDDKSSMEECNDEGDDMVKEVSELSKKSGFGNAFSDPEFSEDSPFVKEQMEEVRGKDAWELNRITEESVSESATDAHSANEMKCVETCVEKVDDSSLAAAHELPSSRFLIWFVGFVFKAIGFQLNIFVMMVLFPFRVLGLLYMITMNPFGTISQIKGRCLNVLEEANNFVSKKIGLVFAGQPSMGKLAKMFGWGFLWSCYVGFVIFGFFILSFCLSGFLMGKFLEEPIRRTHSLSFDYTMDNPIAVVPTNTFEKSEVRHLIPVSRRLQVTISLALPESDYNRKLGVFQVVVDFLSIKGDVLSSSSQPCMLLFKSWPILFAETFLKSVPLLAGFSSESQTLKIRMAGFKEGSEPSASLRVTLKRRAEFRQGEGLPEIYSATLLLESELPILKRIIWSWRRTVFVWIALVFFAIELLFILVCCRHVLYPTSSAAT